MNKKFKNRNRGLVTFGIVALSAVALTASGFAAWVISSADTQTADGQIIVDTVTNNNHTVSVQLTKGKDNIAFGSVTEGNVATWLKNDRPEQLNVEATVTVSNVTTTITSSNIDTILKNPTITIKNGEADYTQKYKDIADGTATEDGIGTQDYDGTKGLVGALPTPTYTFGKYESNTLTCTVTFSFTWGQLFGSKNPCLYYYNQNVDPFGEEAQRRLDKIHTTLNGCNYVLTIESL